MNLYLVENIVGLFVLNEDGKIVSKRLYSESLNKDEIVKYLLSFSLDDISSEIINLLKDLLSELKIENNTLIVEDSTFGGKIRNIFSTTAFDIRIENPSEGGMLFRRNLTHYLVDEVGIFKNIEDYFSLLHEVATYVTRERIKLASEKRDKLIVQTIDAIDDINKTINLMASRIREWYGYHFPELDSIIENHKTYFSIVYNIGSRKNFTLEKLQELGIDEKRAKAILEKTRTSVGASFTNEDIQQMQKFAKYGHSLFGLKDSLEKYVTGLMEEIAPNITAVAGALIGARLIRLAGGLDELAKLPSSTIQVLGAEKALFRALRKKSRPPKHGIIFQHPAIHRAPRWIRGKIARAMAGKISIAAKVDAFSGSPVGESLKADLERRIEEIKRKYPKPPVTTKQPKKKKIPTSKSKKKKRKKSKEKRKSKGDKK